MRKTELINAINEVFPDAYIREVSVNKYGEELEGLSIFKTKPEDDAENLIAPTLYPKLIEGIVDDSFKEYLYNNLTKTWDKMEKVAERALNPKKEDIKMVLRKNIDKDIPHRNFLDLEIIYKVSIKGDGEEYFSATINNALAEKLGYSEEDLFNIALSNMEPPELLSFEGMPVLVNHSLREGSIAIIDDSILKKAYKVLGKFYILPATIHECILIPDDGQNNVTYMSSVVNDINRNILSKEEFLSDTIYYYDGKKVKIA